MFKYLADRVTLPVESRCDFDSNLSCDLVDLDALTMAVAASGAPSFDLNGDGMVDQGDITEWLQIAGLQNLGAGRSYLAGDADLDGFVDGSDFGVWNSFKFTNTGRWSQGDFDADGFTDGSDFNIWNSNKFTSALAAVPEPGSLGVVAWALLALLTRQAVRCHGS